MDEKCSYTNCKDKKAGISTLKADKVDFKTKSVTKDKALYNDTKINARRDIILVNIYVPHTEAPICININRYKGRN